MLQNEVAFRMQYVRCKNLVRNLIQALKCIWRICKHKVKLLTAEIEEIEDIVMHYGKVLQAK